MCIRSFHTVLIISAHNTLLIIHSMSAIATVMIIVCEAGINHVTVVLSDGG